MDLFEEEQKLRAVFTTDPESDPGPDKDRAAGYKRRSRIARWSVRITVFVLLSMISTVLLSEPRIKAFIDDGIAVWRNEIQARVPDSMFGGNASQEQAVKEGAAPRPAVSILPGSAVPIRRAGG